MPTITVDKFRLFEALGHNFTSWEFETLCFNYGIELEEDNEAGDDLCQESSLEPVQVKLEIPANRYDMLCLEGVAMNLNLFCERISPPQYRIVEAKDLGEQKIIVSPETLQIRPYIAGAVLRNIRFTKDRYDSFMALQDKLHQNIGRQRTLVSMGTHDLDTIKGPFTYEALPPRDIVFKPLNQEMQLSGEQLMSFYQDDKHLGSYLHIIRDAPAYPVIFDAERIVCSVPPIVNSDHSKISLHTTNVFIEVTATDPTKLQIVTNVLVTMFSMYCAEKFTVEPVEIVSPHSRESRNTPNLDPRIILVEAEYLNSCTGLDLLPQPICSLLVKMGYISCPSENNSRVLEVTIPLTRPDILHKCDIVEDLAICYGFNKLPRTSSSRRVTIGATLVINKLSDIVRHAAAMAGWSETIPLILCSHDESFTWLNSADDGQTSIRLANPKTSEYQVLRSSLLPGLLKTVRENKGCCVPIKIFEVGDVAIKDDTSERKARNRRQFAAVWCGKSSGFEAIHGLLDRILLMLHNAPLIHEGSRQLNRGTSRIMRSVKNDNNYWIHKIEDNAFFPGYAAAIHLRLGSKDFRIGKIGILHPLVLTNFDISYPISALEISLEPFL